MGDKPAQVLVLDGGMGTTLEQLGVDVSSSLWGSDLLLSDPAPIATVHGAYVDAGADLIESATYPLSVEGIQREYPGMTVDEAEGILHRGLQLALDSRSLSTSGVSSSASTRATVVLALGPLGATLKPGAEYSGLYPAPYGFGTVLDPAPTNVAPTEDAGRGAEDALYRFHLSRLEAYARSPVWSKVEWVGFETIPLVREVRAIRRAIREFRRRRLGASESRGGSGSDRRDAKYKGPKFWIACTFPEGHAPQTDSTVAQTVRALLEPHPATGGEAEGDRDVEGVGINCTNPAWLPDLIDTFNQTLLALSSTSTSIATETVTSPAATPSPWVVLYPDGGQVYDPLTRSWSKERLSAEEWAERMMAAIRQVEASGLWAGVIAGGCCKTSADEISELRQRVDQYLRPHDK